MTKWSISPDSIEIDADSFYDSVLFPATSTLREFVSRDQVYMSFCLLISTRFRVLDYYFDS